jgi:hypothetical protein
VGESLSAVFGLLKKKGTFASRSAGRERGEEKGLGV